MSRKITGEFCCFLVIYEILNNNFLHFRLYLGDKELNVTSFSLLLSVLEYQTAVMRRDFETADRVLPTIPKEHRTRVAHFLEKQGFKKQALQVSTDAEHRFDLSLQIGDLETALQLARESENTQKWSQLAEIATSQNKFELVKECYTRANDFGGLLLLATSSGDADMLKTLGENGLEQGKFNISFLSMFLLGDLDGCLETLIKTNRIPEAGFFARTYLPNKISYVLQLWRQELGKINEKVGQSLADPEQYENLFPGFQESLKTQQYLLANKEVIPANLTPEIPLNISRNAIEEMRNAEENGKFDYDPNWANMSAPVASSSGVTPRTPGLEKEEKLAHKPLNLAPQVPAPSINNAPLIDFSSSANSTNTTQNSTTARLNNNDEDDDDDGMKRKSSLDDFELEIEGINLDDNLDTSVSS